MILTWRKEFKIQVGDGTNCIRFVNVLRQIEVGKERKYAETEILDGVIRSIQPASKLRGYLEGRMDLRLTDLTRIIQSFYKERTATELYQELCQLVQNPKETLQNFVYRALELREKLLFTSNEQEVRYDPVLVETQFRHAISTVLREDVLMAEVQELLWKYKSDLELIQGFNEIAKRNCERTQKLGTTSRKATVAASEVHDPTLRSEVQALRAEVHELKCQIRQKGTTYTPQKANRRKYEACTKNNHEQCRHCFKCGSEGHI